jgi:hypothetical protein
MQSGGVALTEQVRALYEGGVVPVREVARIAGVSERTLYKYVQTLGWTPRVTRRAGDGRPTAAQRAARGAGGRFMALADADKPHARGLKALDPEGARLAGERCRRAAALSQAADAAAQARAARVRAEREAQAQRRIYELLAGALVALGRIFAGAPLRPPARTPVRRAAEQRGGFFVGRRGKEWLLPHERAQEEAALRAGAQRAAAAAVSPQALALAARLQAAILAAMQRLLARPAAGPHPRS